MFDITTPYDNITSEYVASKTNLFLSAFEMSRTVCFFGFKKSRVKTAEINSFSLYSAVFSSAVKLIVSPRSG